LVAVFGHIGVFNAATLAGERFPSGAGKGSGVFTKNQNFGRHAASSLKSDAVAPHKTSEQLPYI
jgi:hypothetical protein